MTHGPIGGTPISVAEGYRIVARATTDGFHLPVLQFRSAHPKPLLIAKQVGSGRDKAGDVTGLNVISLALLFTVRATHGQLTTKPLCTSCVRGATSLMSSGDEVVPDNLSSRRASPDWTPLNADAIVKPSLGTFLGGRAKISISYFYANPIPILTKLSLAGAAMTRSCC